MTNFARQRGVTLIIAVLIMTATTGVALGIFNVVFTQLQINKIARESYKALYSADAGKECVWYYFAKENISVVGGFWNPDVPCGAAGVCQVDCGGLPNAVTATPVATDPPNSGSGCDYMKTKLNLPPALTIINCREYSFKIDNAVICADPINVYAFTVDAAGTVVTIFSSSGKNSCSQTIVTRIIEVCETGDRISFCPQ